MNAADAERLQQIVQVVEPKRWSDIFAIAGADTRRCTKAVVAAAQGDDGARRLDQFWARATVRAFFATVEALTFEMRLALRSARDAKLVNLTPAEYSLISEHAADLDDGGRPQERPRFLTVDRNFRFSYRLFAALFDSDVHLDVSGDGWRKFLSAVKVRNRITHPKAPLDLDLTAGETTELMEAITWYSEAMSSLFGSVAELIERSDAIKKSAAGDDSRSAT